MSSLARDWPAYVLLAGVISFIIYVFIHSRRVEKENKQKKEKD